MMALVDTSVLSLFLRRHEPAEHPAVEVLKKLLAVDQVVVAGLVCQELLSGVRSEQQFEALADILGGFETVYADREDHLLAARFYGACRGNGIQGAAFDFLLCAMAHRRGLSILATDGDFEHYARWIPVSLVPVPTI